MRIARSHENEIVTTARGFRKSTTVMGALTGLGGDVFIIDEPDRLGLEDVRAFQLHLIAGRKPRTKPANW